MANHLCLMSFKLNLDENLVNCSTDSRSFNCVTDCMSKKSSEGNHLPIVLATFSNGGFFFREKNSIFKKNI